MSIVSVGCRSFTSITATPAGNSVTTLGACFATCISGHFSHIGLYNRGVGTSPGITSCDCLLLSASLLELSPSNNCEPCNGGIPYQGLTCASGRGLPDLTYNVFAIYNTSNPPLPSPPLVTSAIPPATLLVSTVVVEANSELLKSTIPVPVPQSTRSPIPAPSNTDLTLQGPDPMNTTNNPGPSLVLIIGLIFASLALMGIIIYSCWYRKRQLAKKRHDSDTLNAFSSKSYKKSNSKSAKIYKNGNKVNAMKTGQNKPRIQIPNSPVTSVFSIASPSIYDQHHRILAHEHMVPMPNSEYRMNNANNRQPHFEGVHFHEPV